MTNEFDRTFRLDRLYHRFLKPRDIPLKYLDRFIDLLNMEGFIELLPDDRYQETPKLTGRANKKEFFKLIWRFKGSVQNGSCS